MGAESPWLSDLQYCDYIFTNFLHLFDKFHKCGQKSKMEESHYIQYKTQGFTFSSLIGHAPKTPPWIH